MMESPSGYRIGKVSKLTGITADTLRIWERRYAAVVPVRTEAGGRLYTADDIARLKLIKHLVDGGDSIGTVASLSIEQLQTRTDETKAAAVQTPNVSPARVVIIGASLSLTMTTQSQGVEGLELVANYLNTNAFLNEHESVEADVLLIELPGIHDETASEVIKLLGHINATHAVVVYRFANQEALDKLPKSRCSTLKAPVSAQTVREHILALRNEQMLSGMVQALQPTDIVEPAPPRRYDDQALAKIASISPVINCECPHHLAELIASISAFEQYSTECESRNLEDAELHGYLSRTASHARHIIENALDMVIEIEKIEL